MAERTLIARVRPDEADPELRVLASPAVGVADGAPPAGAYLNPFDRLLTLTILHRRYTLRLPRDLQGRIVAALVPDAATPVAWDQPLARLDPRALTAETAGAAAAGAGGAGEESGEAGLVVVPAPSEGIFYRRSSPDAPVYVEVGSHVSSGSVLGLVEVMKCFNQIAYGGAGLPERGEIAKILAEDSSEVEFGQPLFWVRPVA